MDEGGLPRGVVTSTMCYYHVEVADRHCAMLNRLYSSQIHLNWYDNHPSSRLWSNGCYRSYRALNYQMGLLLRTRNQTHILSNTVESQDWVPLFHRRSWNRTLPPCHQWNRPCYLLLDPTRSHRNAKRRKPVKVRSKRAEKQGRPTSTQHMQPCEMWWLWGDLVNRGR